MRRLRPLPLLALAAIFGGALVACNFIVEAKLSGTIATVPEGGLPDAECSARNPNTQCYQCINGSCGQYYSAVRQADASITRSLAREVEQCGCDPTVGNSSTWACSNVVLQDAGYVGIMDPPGLANDLRVCITQECMPTCRVCSGLTYKRFPTDTPQPLVPEVNACAQCLLDSCSSVLVDGPPAGKSTTDHCCYSSTVSDLWSDCIMGKSCSAIADALGDGAAANSCDTALAACSAQGCRTACGF
jgi:hypothetical protein